MKAAQFRRRFFDEDDLSRQLWRVAERGDVNVVFVPRSATRYHEYAPLFHLLSRATVERFGLPLLHSGQWPFISQVADIDRYLPRDFEEKLGTGVGLNGLASPDAGIAGQRLLQGRPDPAAGPQPRLLAAAGD